MREAGAQVDQCARLNFDSILTKVSSLLGNSRVGGIRVEKKPHMAQRTASAILRDLLD